MTVSTFVSDLNGLSVDSVVSPAGSRSVMGTNSRNLSYIYSIYEVSFTDGREYTCTASVNHTDPNILTSVAVSDMGTLYVSSKWLLIVSIS